MRVDLFLRYLYGAAHLGRLAQSVEHLTFNQRVDGSNPSAPTKEMQGFLRVVVKRKNHGGAYGEQI